MSHIAHTQPQAVRIRLPLGITLAVVALIAGAAIALFFVLSADDDEVTQSPKPAAAGVRYDGGPEEGTAAVTQRSAPATFDRNSINEAPGVRYDGGPEEGSAQVSTTQPRVSQDRAFPGLAGEAAALQKDGVRYDGGPNEGTAGAVPARQPNVTRYDGGPEEGWSVLGR